MNRSKIVRILAVAMILLPGAGPVAAASAAPTDDAVRIACLATYVHGMTDEIARERVGTRGIPRLLALLEEPGFPRRDNIVAFLAHLAGDEATDPLLRLLDEWDRAQLRGAAAERALLLVPQALGRVAGRGGSTALEALLEMTGPTAESSLLARVANPQLRVDLREQALAGLALSGLPTANDRIDRIAGSTAVPQRLAETARRLRSLIDSSGESVEDRAERETDGHVVSRRSRLSAANHAAVGFPVSGADVDGILSESSGVAGKADTSADVACCTTFERTGDVGLFGDELDGQDIIDFHSEMVAVLGDPVARVKVVRMINYCGGAGTNIVGCAFSPGPGMAVVRLASHEGLLWLHEYGHNTGLSHNSTSGHVMYHVLSSGSLGLTASECDTFHFPYPAAGAVTEETGDCHDDDLDDLASSIDNCPHVFNPTQIDTDGDGLGDECEACLDRDGDGFGSPPDPECPAGDLADCDDLDRDTHPGAVDLCDGRDNDCDGAADATLCNAFEATGDSMVNGMELTWLGRAFGECVGETLPWWSALDYDGNGCVDGDDLTILAAAWGCRGLEPICN